MTSRAKRMLTAASGAAVTLWLPSAALACAVCMTGLDDDTRLAFEWMTAFMTVIPFVFGGGVWWWLRGRLKEIESRHEQARATGEALSNEAAMASAHSTHVDPAAAGREGAPQLVAVEGGARR